MTPSKEVKARIEKEAAEAFPYYQMPGNVGQSTANIVVNAQRKAYIVVATKYEAELSSLREKIVEVAGEAWDKSFANIKIAQAVSLETFKYMKHARTEHLTALKSKINSSK